MKRIFTGLLNHPIASGIFIGGPSNAAVWDTGNLSNNKGWRSIPGIGTIADLVEGKMSPVRRNNLILNSILGVAAGTSGAAGLKKLRQGNAVMGAPLAGLGLTGFLATPYKDVSQTANAFLDKNMQVGKDVMDKIDAHMENAKSKSNITNWLLGGALGLGAGGLLYSMLKKDKPEKAKMKVKLPGDPNDPDSDVTLEVPVTAGRIKPEVMQGIRRSLRKQTAKNIRSQQRKRDLETGKLIPYDEWQAKYGEEPYGTQKVASSWLEKEAEGREYSEGLGSLLAPAIGGLAAAYVAKKHTGDNTKAVLAGAGASILPMLAGSLLGRAANKHTAEQQKEHDAAPALLEYLVPGYAQYQSARRQRAATPVTAEGVGIEDAELDNAELDTDDDLDYEDELDKYAAQAPAPASQLQQGAPQGPVVPPMPAPGMVGSRPDKLISTQSITADLNNQKPDVANSAKGLRQAATDLSSWLDQYTIRQR